MNELRKKIVYNYIIITIILLVVEWNVFHLFEIYLPSVSQQSGISAELIKAFGLLAVMIVFFAVSLIYYRRMKRCVAEETQRQIQKRSLLFANISHDLKNPMSSVIGFARALENGNVDEADLMLTYHTICKKSLQMDEMIQKMFQFAKMESDGYHLQTKECDISGLLRSIVAGRYLEIEQHEILLQVEIPETPVRIQADETELTRALNNLISNVMQHNENGIRMLVSMQQSDSSVKIVIADSGIRLPDEIRENLFEPFRVSDESRRTKNGSGLGLAISKRITELHGGRLTLNEQIKDYTKGFVMELPRAKHI